MSSPDLPTLPGEAAVDDTLVDDVVARINATLHQRGLETAKALGRIVLDAFFAGDPSNFQRRGKRHTSFRQLARREDLQVSHATLWTAVALIGQLEQLPPHVGEALPLSHHRVLLRLRDPDAKLTLARQALDEGLSKRAFAERVRGIEGNGDRSRGGRPPQPAFVKAFKRLDDAIEVASSQVPTADVLSDWGIDRSRAAISDAKKRLAQLQHLVGALERALAESAPVD